MNGILGRLFLLVGVLAAYGKRVMFEVALIVLVVSVRCGQLGGDAAVATARPTACLLLLLAGI
jgi:hypothetical protein